MATQPNRSKPGSISKKLASVNFPVELLEQIDAMAEELGFNRSSLVVRILEDFIDSGKTFELMVVNNRGGA